VSLLFNSVTDAPFPPGGAALIFGAMSETLVVNEIYLSLQGESTFAGLPCIFVRLTGCDLRCSYCDTAYAFAEGKRMLAKQIIAEVRRLAKPFGEVQSPKSKVQSPESEVQGLKSEVPPAATARQCGESPKSEVVGYRLPLVELTGGEPLLQKNSLPLMGALCDDGFTVLLETSGAHDIAAVDARVRRIVDLKCPGSGEVERNRWENLRHLKPTDEIKFVIATREDYEWARACIAERGLAAICPVLFSWAHPLAAGQRDKSLKPVPPGQTPISRRELAEKIIADALPVRFQVQLHKVIWPPDQKGV
jgi:7-carboxy-7-deazaguanine synthase